MASLSKFDLKMKSAMSAVVDRPTGMKIVFLPGKKLSPKAAIPQRKATITEGSGGI